MKKYLTLLALLGAFALAGCNNNTAGGEQGGGGQGGGGEGGGTTEPQEFVVNAGDFDLESGTVLDSHSLYGITFTFNKNSGSSDPVFWVDNRGEETIRTYKDNTMTIAAKDITNIELTVTDKAGTYTVDKGTLSTESLKETWTGKEDSVTFTVSSGQRRIVSMKITCIGDPDAKPTKSHSPRSVINDIVESIFEDPSEAEIENDGGDYYTWVLLDSTYTLQTAVEELEDYLPDYLLLFAAGAEFTWEDDTDGYGVTYITDDEKVFAELGSWEEGDDIVVQICTYLANVEY